VSEPSETISVAEVKTAIAKMKNNKPAGLSGCVSECFKCRGKPVQSVWLTFAMQLLKMV